MPARKTILHHKKVIGFGVNRKIHGIRQPEKTIKVVQTNQIGIGSVFKPNRTGDKVKIGGKMVGIDIDKNVIHDVTHTNLADLKKINFKKMKRDNIQFII
jgi:hypothetical protein